VGWRLTPAAAVLFTCAAILLFVSITVWRRRATAGGRSLLSLVLAVFAWTAAFGLEAAAATRASKVWWAKVGYLSALGVPVLVFLAARSFARFDLRFLRRRLGLLWMLPAALALLTVTNGGHRLIWTAIEAGSPAGADYLVYKHGPAHGLALVYGALLILASAAMLASAAARFRGVLRRQALDLLSALPWPAIAGLLAVLGLWPVPSLDPLAIAFTLTTLIYVAAVYRLQIADLVPVARERVIDSMSEGLIILDREGRLAAINPAARRLLGMIGATEARLSEAQLVGQPVSQVFALWPVLAKKLSDPVAGQADISWLEGNKRRDFDLRLSPLAGRRGRLAGWVAVVYDITRLKWAEEDAVRGRKVAETLRAAGVTLSSTLDELEVSRLILGQLQKVMPFDTGLFFRLRGNELEVAGALGVPEGTPLTGRRVHITEYPLGYSVIEGREPLIIARLKGREMLLPFVSRQPMVSFLGVPLVFGNTACGLIALYSARPAYFSDEEERVAALFANQAAIALENSHFFAEISRLASTDSLTGISNRHHFFEQADKEFRRALRYHRPLSIIMFDIDNFKRVNDRYGHLAGDQVLKTVASTVQKAIRDVDILCRYGGEEFIVVLPETELEPAVGGADRLRHEVEELVVHTDGGPVKVTISLGVAALREEPGPNLERIISRADDALYAAKSAGRNKVMAETGGGEAPPAITI
jgi:diguanylate cyclase (GGDEF)-like protein/PAS domain S-box-containing protein